MDKNAVKMLNISHYNTYNIHGFPKNLGQSYKFRTSDDKNLEIWGSPRYHKNYIFRWFKRFIDWEFIKKETPPKPDIFIILRITLPNEEVTCFYNKFSNCRPSMISQWSINGIFGAYP